MDLHADHNIRTVVEGKRNWLKKTRIPQALLRNRLTLFPKSYLLRGIFLVASGKVKQMMPWNSKNVVEKANWKIQKEPFLTNSSRCYNMQNSKCDQYAQPFVNKIQFWNVLGQKICSIYACLTRHMSLKTTVS